MLKVGSLLFCCLLLVGCSSKKTDEQLIMQTFEQAKKGNVDVTFVINMDEADKEIKKNHLENLAGITKAIEIKAGKFSTCTAAVSDVKGKDWAYFHTSCKDLDGWGDYYVKKINGEWKIPVRE